MKLIKRIVLMLTVLFSFKAQADLGYALDLFSSGFDEIASLKSVEVSRYVGITFDRHTASNGKPYGAMGVYVWDKNRIQSSLSMSYFSAKSIARVVTLMVAGRSGGINGVHLFSLCIPANSTNVYLDVNQLRPNEEVYFDSNDSSQLPFHPARWLNIDVDKPRGSTTAIVTTSSRPAPASFNCVENSPNLVQLNH